VHFWVGNEVRCEKKCEFFFGEAKNHFEKLPVLGLDALARKCGAYVMGGIFLWTPNKMRRVGASAALSDSNVQ